MRAGRKSRWTALITSAISMIVLASIAGGQVQRQKREPRKANREAPPPPLVGAPLKKPRPDAADPLAAAVAKKTGTASLHYMFRLRSYDGTPLAASYYPARSGSSAPVVMLVHEPGRSRKDFEDAILDLKGQGLAEHLQAQGFAVLSFDLRGQGQNVRRALTPQERPLYFEDLQAAYFFLVDRHNRGDLNLMKLGIVALGSSANMVAAWAVQPGAAVTSEGRSSDVNALVLLSPRPEGFGFVLGHLVGALTPRVPLFLVAGDRDKASRDAVQSIRARVERSRLNKVELFPSSLQGYKLLRLEPKAAVAVMRFLDTSLKNRAVEWEPRYNLTPVGYGEIHVVTKAASSARKEEAGKGVAAKAVPAAAAAPAAPLPGAPKAAPAENAPPPQPRPAPK